MIFVCFLYARCVPRPVPVPSPAVSLKCPQIKVEDFSHSEQVLCISIRHPRKYSAHDRLDGFKRRFAWKLRIVGMFFIILKDKESLSE
jgi:hypothetical protein